MKTKITVLVSILLIIAVISGCTVSKQQEMKDYSNKVITIYTSHDERSFYQFYGNIILEYFPNLSINLIYADEISSLEELSSQLPDLIISHYDKYKELREQDYLMNLSSLEKTTDVDTSDYADNMLNALRDNTGVLYGLAPNVYVIGMFYNKDLFNEFHVEYPTNDMDWNETMLLASHFNNGVIGLEGGFTGPEGFLMEIANTNHWKIFNQSNEIEFAKSEWSKAIQNVVNLYQSQSISSSSMEGFVKGKSALYSSSTSTINTLMTNNDFSWGFVPSPVDSNNRGMSKSIFFAQVVSIPRVTTQKDLSVEVLNVLMGDDAADHYVNHIIFPTVSTRKNKMNNFKGVDVSGFWSQSINTNPESILGDVSSEFIEEFYAILRNKLNGVITNEITVDECLDLIIERTVEAYSKEELRHEQR